MAAEAVGQVYDAMEACWKQTPGADPVSTALGYLVHPRNTTRTKVIDLAQTWAQGKCRGQDSGRHVHRLDLEVAERWRALTQCG